MVALTVPLAANDSQTSVQTQTTKLIYEYVEIQAYQPLARCRPSQWIRKSSHGRMIIVRLQRKQLPAGCWLRHKPRVPNFHFTETLTTELRLTTQRRAV
jgi:hypothetical protein